MSIVGAMSMQDEIAGWLQRAKNNLNSVRNEKANGNFPEVAHNLQQAEEKTAKATLMCIHFSTTTSKNPKLSNIQIILNSLFGIDIITPKEYTHNWRKKFLENIEKIYSSPIFTTVLAAQQQGSVKDIKDKIKKARDVKDIVDITLEDIDVVIYMCNELLNSTIETSGKPIKLNSGLQQADINVNAKLVDTISNLLDISEDECRKSIVNILTISMNIIVLAILDIILAPYEDSRFYPDTKYEIKYDENLPIVKRAEEIVSILERCNLITENALKIIR